MKALAMGTAAVLLVLNKPVGDWISAPSPNFVAMAARVGVDY